MNAPRENMDAAALVNYWSNEMIKRDRQVELLEKARVPNDPELATARMNMATAQEMLDRSQEQVREEHLARLAREAREARLAQEAREAREADERCSFLFRDLHRHIKKD